MAQLAPPIKFRIVGADGLALVGGKVYTYAAGTSTPKATYVSLGGAANTNPVILDARGEADIWLDGSYKISVTDANDVPLHTVDNVRETSTGATFTNATLAGTLTITSTAVTWSGNPTHSGDHTFTGVVAANGNVVLGNAASDDLTIAADAVTWSGNPTHSGNHSIAGTLAVAGASTLTGVATFSANPAGRITGTTYTPTLTNGANVAASTPAKCIYARVGSAVMVQGVLNVDPTAAASATTVIGVSLPIASNFASSTDLSGTINTGGFATSDAGISADIANDRATIVFASNTTSAFDLRFQFGYEVI
jgi:hypothetical protein